MLNKEDRDLAAGFGDGGLGPLVSAFNAWEGPENPLRPRLRGRALWLRERGRIKDAELMEEAAAHLDCALASISVIAKEPQ